jgi:hypothetical protein
MRSVAAGTAACIGSPPLEWLRKINVTPIAPLTASLIGSFDLGGAQLRLHIFLQRLLHLLQQRIGQRFAH